MNHEVMITESFTFVLSHIGEMATPIMDVTVTNKSK